MTEVVVVQSSSQIITTNKPAPSFLEVGCPSCRPTNRVKELKVMSRLQFCIPSNGKDNLMLIDARQQDNIPC